MGGGNRKMAKTKIMIKKRIRERIYKERIRETIRRRGVNEL